MDYVIYDDGFANLPTFAKLDSQGNALTSFEAVDTSALQGLMPLDPVITPDLTLGLKYLFSKRGYVNGLHNGKLFSPSELKPFFSEQVILPDAALLAYVKRNRIPRAIFEQQRSRGDIVLRPLENVSLRCQPRLLPGTGDPIIEHFVVHVGINNYELGQRRNVPNSYYYSWLNNVEGVPFDAPFTSIFTKDWLDLGRVQGDKFMKRYRGSPSNSFKEWGEPDLAGLVEFIKELPPPVNLKTYALDEAYAGAYDAMTEVFELPETLKYIYQILMRIVRLATGFRAKAVRIERKYQRELKRAPTNMEIMGRMNDEIASLWMQFRYAASPLAYSAQDAMELLFTAPQTYVTVRKRQDVPFRYESGNHVVTGTAEHRCFVKIKLKQSRVSRIGLNPIKSLWEVTPMAFVTGWVLPIGSLLGSIMPPNRVDDIGVMESVKVSNLTSNLHHLSGNVYVARPTNAVPNGFGFDAHMTCKRYLDSLALSWGLFIKQHWKSPR